MENVMINENLSPDELQHWGIKGMKWGVRRYQNKDGSYTAEGRKRYSGDGDAETNKENDAETSKEIDMLKRRVDKSYRKSRLAEVSGLSKDQITKHDLDTYGYYVTYAAIRLRNSAEGTYKNPQAIESFAKMMKDDCDISIESYENAVKSQIPTYVGGVDAATMLVNEKTYRDRYLRDGGENFAKNVLEEAEDRNRLYDLIGSDAFRHSDLSPDELQHWGIKGMKWGIRRWQNKDGSLTPAGEKRRQTLGERYHAHKVNKKRKAALEKARAAKVAKKEAEEKAKVEAEKREKAIKAGLIPVKKMTDAELADHITRLTNEKKYKELQLDLSPTKKLMNKMYNDAVIPGLTSAGKNLVEKYVNKTVSDYLGLDKKAKSELDKLKEQADMAKQQADIAKYRKQIREDNDIDYQKVSRDAEKSKWTKQMLDDEHDRFNMQQKLNAAKKGEVYKTPEAKERERKQAEEKAEKERKEAEEKAEKKRKEAEAKAKAEKERKEAETKAYAQKRVDEYNNEWARANDGRYGKQYRKGTNVDDINYAETRETGSKTVAGLLSGPVASTKTSNLPSTYVRSGQNTVNDSRTAVVDKDGNVIVYFDEIEN